MVRQLYELVQCSPCCSTWGWGESGSSGRGGDTSVCDMRRGARGGARVLMDGASVALARAAGLKQNVCGPGVDAQRLRESRVMQEVELRVW